MSDKVVLKFNDEFIKKIIVDPNYDDINDLKKALKLDCVNKQAFEIANSPPKEEQREPATPSRPTSVAIEEDLRTSQDLTYIDGVLYSSKEALSKDSGSDSSFQKAYYSYRQKHCKPFCATIDIVNLKSVINADGNLDTHEIPNRYLINSDANVTRIFKKIGQEYYYIAVERDIKITDMRLEYPREHLLAFDVVTIFKIPEEPNDELIFDDMLAPEGCVPAVEVYFQDPMHLVITSEVNQEEDNLLTKYDQQLNALRANQNSPLSEYINITENILQISDDEIKNKYKKLIRDVNEQTESLKQNQSISEQDIKNYLQLIIEIEKSANDIYIGGGREISSKMRDFIISLLNQRQKNNLLYHEALSRLELYKSRDDVKPILLFLKAIELAKLTDKELEWLKSYAEATLSILQVGAPNAADVEAYKNKIKALSEMSFANNLAQAAALLLKSLESAQQKLTDRKEQIKITSPGPRKFVKNKTAEEIVKAIYQNSTNVFNALDYQGIDLRDSQESFPAEGEGWANHRGENDTYIRSESASGFHYLPPRNHHNYDMSIYKANHVVGLVYGLKRSKIDQFKNINISASFSRIYDEKSNQLYVVERNIKFTRESVEYILPYEVVHVYCKYKNKWEYKNTYAPKVHANDLNNLIKKEFDSSGLKMRVAYEKALQELNLGPYNNFFIKQLKIAINALDPKQLTNSDCKLLTKVIEESKKFPKINFRRYNTLIEKIMQSGIGSKTKIQYDVIAHNPLESSMLAILVIATVAFILITCLPVAGPLLALIGLEYCVGGAIVTTAMSLPFGMHLKRWSPLYDSMTTISRVNNANIVNDSPTPKKIAKPSD